MLEASRVVEDGGDPPGLGTDIYELRAIEKILPSNVDLRTALHKEFYQKAQYSPDYKSV